ncbi:lysylphosphatidylglycerol synthase domain-containing protein [Novipirellula caenicola]|uniref:Uncharacterized protein n=1 Tax=Novipirellula caenicola TaxID=1536901 RepID=A0ABP9VL54_9BACT
MSDVSSPGSASHRHGRKRWLRIAKIAIAIAVVIGLFFAVRSAARQWQTERARVVRQIHEIDLQIAATEDVITTSALQEQRAALRRSLPTLGTIRWSRIGVAAILYAAGTLVSGIVLRDWLVVLGHRPPAALVVAAQMLGHIGKYVPGKAMVVVLRVGVLKRCSVPVMPATICVFLETFMMMAVGAAVAGIVIVTLPVPVWMMVAAATGAVLASIPTMPPVLQIVTNRLMKQSSDLGHHAWIACGKGWAWSTIEWILIGGSFAMIVTAIPTAAPPESTAQLLAIATASISLAMVIGFASLLPGGAGIRELVLTTILGLVTGPTHALLAAIMARMVFIAVESLMALAAWVYIQNQLEPVRHEICSSNE